MISITPAAASDGRGRRTLTRGIERGSAGSARLTINGEVVGGFEHADFGNALFANVELPSGTAVPQLYLGFPEDSSSPPWQLKGFASVTLEPGEEQMVEITVPAEQFRHRDTAQNGWCAGK